MRRFLDYAIHALLDSRQAVAADLMRELLHVPIPPFDDVYWTHTILGGFAQTKYRADAVILCVDERRRPVYGIVLEIQIPIAADRRFKWPLYLMKAREWHKCPFVMLVVTPEAATARWAASPATFGGDTWTPHVLGPQSIPLVTSIMKAVGNPHIAMLSFVAHGRTDDVRTEIATAEATMSGAKFLPNPRLGYVLVDRTISEAARKELPPFPHHRRVPDWLPDVTKQKTKATAMTTDRDVLSSNCDRYLHFRTFPSDSKLVTLTIEGMVLRELLVDGNGKDGDWTAVAADGRSFTISVSACHWKIAIEGAVLTEVLGPDDLSLCIRYTAERLVVREARIHHPGGAAQARRDVAAFGAGKEMEWGIQHGRLTLVGEAARPRGAAG